MPRSAAAFGASDSQTMRRVGSERGCPGGRHGRAGTIRDQNAGVGEHVRIRSRRGSDAFADCRPNSGPAPNEEIVFLLPDRHAGGISRAGPDPAVDLMSRRHPLHQLKPVVLVSSPGSKRARPSNDVPASKLPAHLARTRDVSYFFLETFLVFLAVFFAAVFAVFFTAFFAFFAFLAIVPSDMSWLSRCVHSGIEMRFYSNTPTD